MKFGIRSGRTVLIASTILFSAACVARSQTAPTTPRVPIGDATLQYLDQGSSWNAATRADFYTRDQGSRMFPLAWIKALTTSDGTPFLADGLARYGYLPNPGSDSGLPVGFTASGPSGDEVMGMNCAACHTRQIVANGQSYRVDGGPALVDFQSFLSDLDQAVLAVLKTDASFAAFSTAVLGSGAPPQQVAALKAAVSLWSQREHTLMSRALPHDPWGLGRLDAVGMIFNRLAGLDLGEAPTYLIADNIQTADAPTRYPFLWNAAIQDKTQWPGFADNGNDILGLSRNLGEVYGVYGVFHPTNSSWRLSGVDFNGNNSANFDGLNHLEHLVRKIGAPKWPWPTDLTLAAQGQQVYDRPTAQGGCAECHGERPGTTRFLFQKTWATPIMDVGTDSREYAVLTRTAKTGVLEGKHIPLLTSPLKATDTAFSVLGLSVLGSILQYKTFFAATAPAGPGVRAMPQAAPLTPAEKDLAGAFRSEALTPPPAQYPYESRAMKGIWAAAPYLHNGSVPTLADLLKPVAQRPTRFAVGKTYDTVLVGLARDQGPSRYVRVTTGCEDRNSGNSRCGHTYGTTLPDADKRALLEYLKVL